MCFPCWGKNLGTDTVRWVFLFSRQGYVKKNNTEIRIFTTDILKPSWVVTIFRYHSSDSVISAINTGPTVYNGWNTQVFCQRYSCLFIPPRKKKCLDWGKFSSTDPRYAHQHVFTILYLFSWWHSENYIDQCLRDWLPYLCFRRDL